VAHFSLVKLGKGEGGLFSVTPMYCNIYFKSCVYVEGFITEFKLFELCDVLFVHLCRGLDYSQQQVDSVPSRKARPAVSSKRGDTSVE
jgi:hypothetical protein